MPFEWLAKIPALTPANLTFRERARLAENPEELRWTALAPFTPAASIKLSDITTVDYRPVGGRREWNAQGRELVDRLGPVREFEMVPINPTHHFDERRLQLLEERSQGVDELIRRGIMQGVSEWATTLSGAAYRQVERDFFQSWATNSLTVYDPKTEKSVSVSMGIDSARYVTELTIWSNGGINAYTRLLYHLGEAQRLMGSVRAVRMRRLTLNEVVLDAPNGPNALRPTVANLQDRLSEEGFGDITIIVDERTYEEQTDGGSAYTDTHYVPTGKVLFQPGSGVVARTHVAPVTRAYSQFSPEQVKAGAAQGVTIILSSKNDGKTLLEEAQMNALSINDPQMTYVVDAGV